MRASAAPVRTLLSGQASDGVSAAGPFPSRREPIERSASSAARGTGTPSSAPWRSIARHAVSRSAARVDSGTGRSPDRAASSFRNSSRSPAVPRCRAPTALAQAVTAVAAAVRSAPSSRSATLPPEPRSDITRVGGVAPLLATSRGAGTSGGITDSAAHSLAQPSPGPVNSLTISVWSPARTRRTRDRALPPSWSRNSTREPGSNACTPSSHSSIETP